MNRYRARSATLGTDPIDCRYADIQTRFQLRTSR